MAQQNPVQPNLDPASILKLYQEAMEAWTKNYESFTKAMADVSRPIAASGVAESLGQGFPAQFFQKVVETEMELCRFYEKRWSEYSKLPQAIASCKSPMELAELERNFCSAFTRDYTNEGSKLFSSFTELMSHSGVRSS
ncbi:MAG: hypothetical protein ACLPX9_01605 [Rhodomicrobium sp.]